MARSPGRFRPVLEILRNSPVSGRGCFLSADPAQHVSSEAAEAQLEAKGAVGRLKKLVFRLRNVDDSAFGTSEWLNILAREPSDRQDPTVTAILAEGRPAVRFSLTHWMTCR